VWKRILGRTNASRRNSQLKLRETLFYFPGVFVVLRFHREGYRFHCSWEFWINERRMDTTRRNEDHVLVLMTSYFQSSVWNLQEIRRRYLFSIDRWEIPSYNSKKSNNRHKDNPCAKIARTAWEPFTKSDWIRGNLSKVDGKWWVVAVRMAIWCKKTMHLR